MILILIVQKGSESRKEFVQQINDVIIIVDAAEYLFAGSDFKQFRSINVHTNMFSNY